MAFVAFKFHFAQFIYIIKILWIDFRRALLDRRPKIIAELDVGKIKLH